MNTLKRISRSRILWTCVLVFCLFPGMARAQGNFSPSELDTLVSTIALYPDPLLVHVLTASTYGNQIPGANAFAQAHKNQKGESLAESIEQAKLSYDPSVQALIPFPTVLEVLAKYPTWTDQLGDAVTSQKEEVLDAVQRMRRKAYDYGHLKTNEQVTVTVDTTIVVQPTRTEYVYVPVYNPRVVYYVRSDGYVTHVHYGSGVWLGTWYGKWGWGSCWFDWGPRVIYVRNYRWYPRRPIPRHPPRYNPPPRRTAPAPRPTYAPAPRSASPAPLRRTESATRVDVPASRSNATQPSQTGLRRTTSELTVAPAPAPNMYKADESRRMDDSRTEGSRVAPAAAPAPSTRNGSYSRSETQTQRTTPAPAPRSNGRSSGSDRGSSPRSRR